jgi:hypothetical protein
MKRLLALVAGGLGLRALLKRRSRPDPSPAEDLRAKLADAKAQDAAPEQEPESVDGRRADVHAKARQAIDDLGAP